MILYTSPSTKSPRELCFTLISDIQWSALWFLRLQNPTRAPSARLESKQVRLRTRRPALSLTRELFVSQHPFLTDINIRPTTLCSPLPPLPRWQAKSPHLNHQLARHSSRCYWKQELSIPRSFKNYSSNTEVITTLQLPSRYI